MQSSTRAGGVLAANLIALHLNRPLVDVDGFLQGRQWHGGERQALFSSSNNSRAAKALVVDDTVHRGNEIRKVKERINAAGLGQRVVYACVYVAPESQDKVDFWCEVVPPPRVFEWNLMHHSFLDDACMDIDGVLCRDPTPEENDDGPGYRAFVANVEPLLIPTVRIGHLVTSRLEKYRELTVSWLSRHRVNYRELVMMNYATKDERIAAGSHAEFKAQVYKRTEALLFVESDREQAGAIARLSGWPVFCYTTREMVQPQGRTSQGGVQDHS
jgi:orotate phosphoribosyltransferase